MSSISFTQYLLPHGRKAEVSIDRPDEIAALARVVQGAGYSFACELLSDQQTVSLTVENDDGDFDIEVCAQGPAVPLAVDTLVRRAALRLSNDGTAP